MISYFFASCTQWIISSEKKISKGEKIANCEIHKYFLGLGRNAIQANTRDKFFLSYLQSSLDQLRAHFPVCELSRSLILLFPLADYLSHFFAHQHLYHKGKKIQVKRKNDHTQAILSTLKYGFKHIIFFQLLIYVYAWFFFFFFSFFKFF